MDATWTPFAGRSAGITCTDCISPFRRITALQTNWFSGTEGRQHHLFKQTDQSHNIPVLSHVLRYCIGACLLLLLNLGTAEATAAAVPEITDGAVLFEQHCAGCHINGGNIIRRGKNLKLKTLERDDIATVDAIAAIAREGRGQMSGYADVLGADGDQLVAEWILMQAQNAWTHG